MTTVTGFTAERMLAIENSTIQSGLIVGDDLILRRKDGTDINAGNVRGPVGPVGPAGPTNPSGMIMMFGGDIAPAGYLLCQGQSLSRTGYATLFAAISTKYGSVDANSFSLPDLRSRMPVGLGAATWSDALGEIGGSANSQPISHQHTLPSHQHGMNHDHGAAWTSNVRNDHSHGMSHSHPDVWSSVQGSHYHTPIYGGQFVEWNPTDPVGTLRWGTIADLPVRTYSVDANAGDHQHVVSTPPFYGSTENYGWDHSHTASVPAFAGSTAAGGNVTSNASGVDGTNMNLPPYIVLNFIIKT